MSDSVRNLKDLFALILKNPSLATRLKSEPTKVAEMFGVTLSPDEAKNISANLNIDEILKLATDVDAMPMKVAQGVGIKRKLE